jgi:hypothetical protein
MLATTPYGTHRIPITRSLIEGPNERPEKRQPVVGGSDSIVTGQSKSAGPPTPDETTSVPRPILHWRRRTQHLRTAVGAALSDGLRAVAVDRGRIGFPVFRRPARCARRR